MEMSIKQVTQILDEKSKAGSSNGNEPKTSNSNSNGKSETVAQMHDRDDS